jgi:hypothetical protein
MSASSSRWCPLVSSVSAPPALTCHRWCLSTQIQQQGRVMSVVRVQRRQRAVRGGGQATCIGGGVHRCLHGGVFKWGRGGAGRNLLTVRLEKLSRIAVQQFYPHDRNSTQEDIYFMSMKQGWTSCELNYLSLDGQKSDIPDTLAWMRRSWIQNQSGSLCVDSND